MIVHCPECDARFQVDGARIPPSGGRGRCSRCQTVFTVAAPPSGRPVIEGFQPDPSRETVEALRSGGARSRSTTFPVGVDDPALTQKIDARQLASRTASPRAMTYRSLAAPDGQPRVAAEGTAVDLPAGPADADLVPDLLDGAPAREEADAVGVDLLSAVEPAAPGPGAAPAAGGRPSAAGREGRRGSAAPSAAAAPAAELDSPPVSPPSAAARVAEPGGERKRYRVLGPDGGEVTFEKAELVRRIREGRLAEDDAVAREGGDWTGAGSLAELARYFELARRSGLLRAVPPSEETAAPPAPLACAAHADRPPGWMCADCQKGLCDECIRMSRVGLSELATCIHCGGAARELARRAGAPFWQDLAGLMKVCFAGYGLVMTFFYAALYWAARLAFALPVPGLFKASMMISGALVFLFLVTFDMLVVTSAARGGRRLPDWPDFTDWGQIFGRGLKGWLVYVAVHAPIVIFVLSIGGDALSIAMATGSPQALVGVGMMLVSGTLALLAFAFVVYPMCFALVSSFDSVTLALNPSAVLGSIRKAPAEYLMLLAILFALGLTSKVLQIGLAFIPVAGGMVGALVHALARLTQMHTLGRMVHQCDHKMGWDD